MRASETRAIAREKLAGKWKSAVCATLVFIIIEAIISGLLKSFEDNSFLKLIGSFISLIITVPMSYGILATFFKLNDDEDISYVGFLNDGFSNFKKVWGVTLQTILKLLIPFVLFIGSIILLAFSTTATIIGGGSGFLLILSRILYIAALVYFILKSLSYSLALNILYDNPDMDSKEIVEKSAELMEGNIGSYICLKLSFLGWAILAVLPFGLGIFWLIPYAQLAEINFYRNLTNE